MQHSTLANRREAVKQRDSACLACVLSSVAVQPIR